MKRRLKKRTIIFLTLGAVSAVAAAAGFGLHWYARHTAASVLDQFVGNVPWVHHATYRAMDVDLFVKVCK